MDKCSGTSGFGGNGKNLRRETSTKFPRSTKLVLLDESDKDLSIWLDSNPVIGSSKSQTTECRQLTHCAARDIRHKKSIRLVFTPKTSNPASFTQYGQFVTKVITMTLLKFNKIIENFLDDSNAISLLHEFYTQLPEDKKNTYVMALIGQLVVNHGLLKHEMKK